MSRFIRPAVLAASLLLMLSAPALAYHVPEAGDVHNHLQMVDNPYGLDALWSQSDIVSRSTLVLLGLMSMASWYVLIAKLIEQTRIMRRAKAAAGFWKAATIAAGIETLAEDSPFRFIAQAGQQAVAHHRDTLLEKIDLHTWVSMSIQRAIDEITGELQGGLAVLATVGSTGPFVGLFGTVWGIYHALTAIGIAGQASIDKVAGPVGEALIMTAIGLAVAVPAVLGYNLLVRRNKAAGDKVRAFGSDLHSILLAS